MKKLILFLAIVLPLFSHAEKETELVKEIRSFYDELDHSGMKTDYLFNRGFVILNDLEEWNKNQPIITNNHKWEYLIQGISNSKVLGDVGDTVNYNFAKGIDESDIQLTVVNYKGDYLSVANIEQNIKAKNAPEYGQMNIFAGNVNQQRVYSGDVEFHWSPKNYISNRDSDAELYVDFSDLKGFVPISVGKEDVIQVKYDCIGEKSICFKLVQDTDTLISFSKITVVTLEKAKPTYSGTLTCSVNDTSNLKSASSDPNVSLSYANYDYHEGADGVLDKPIIIAEGFDILGTMSTDDLYSKWQSRLSSLTSHGYDVFVLDFTAPTRSLQTNAGIVEDLIRGINQDKVGNYEGVYIGESMGGIIGRIALKNMENSGYDHQIGLFVPYDSPMKGANIPIGAQWALHDLGSSLGWQLAGLTFLIDLFEFLGGDDVAYLDIYTQLNSTAAKQMLARHYCGRSDYNSFQSYLNNLGYPSQTRNVAIVNGSNNATFQSAAMPNDTMFNTNVITVLWNISARAWYDQVNVVNQKVSRVAYFSTIAPGFVKYRRRLEDFDNKPYVNAPGSYIDVDYQSIKFTFVPTLSAIDISNSIYNSNFAYFNNNEDYIINNGLTPMDDIYSDAGSGYSTTYRHGNKYHTTKSFKTTDLFEKEIMPVSMYLQNRNINNDRDFESSSSIVVGKSVHPWGNNKHQGEGNFVINSNANVTMESGQTIKLKSGFKLCSGATFKANIDVTDPTLKSNKIQKVSTPILVGKKNAREGDVFRILNVNEYENEKISWKLIGNEYKYECQNEFFVIPSDLSCGQYMLTANISSRKGKSASSKVIVFDKVKNNDFLENEDVSGFACKIYPNPAINEIIFEIENIDHNVMVFIKNVMGHNILQKSGISSTKFSIDITSLQKGIYVIELVQDNKTVYTKKIIKK